MAPPLKILQIPISSKNAYQDFLIAGLRSQGHTVETVEFKDIRGWQPLSRYGWKKFNVIHLHWVHGFYQSGGLVRSLAKSLFMFLDLFCLRLLGVRLVWTVHELLTHDALHPRLDRAVCFLTGHFCHQLIVHCEAARSMVVKKWRIRPGKVSVIPHGSYRGYYPDTVTREQARARLDLEPDARVILFFGAIRADKNILELVRAFSAIGRPRDRLLVAGWVWEQALVPLLERAAAQDPRIRISARYIPDDEVQVYMRAADVVVLPYRDVLTSGVIVLARDFGRTVVAPAIGCLPEQLGKAKGVLYDPADPASLQKAMISALEMQELPAGPEADRSREAMTWSRIALLTASTYLTSPPGGADPGRA